MYHRFGEGKYPSTNTTVEQLDGHIKELLSGQFRILSVPEIVESKFREMAGELAPDPLNVDRLRLNRLLHQTPDLPDRS